MGIGTLRRYHGRPSESGVSVETSAPPAVDEEQTAPETEGEAAEVETTEVEATEEETAETEAPTVEVPAVELPKMNSSKADWRVFAMANGKTVEDLEGLGRDEIAALFTE